MSAQSFWSPDFSQKDCLPGSAAKSVLAEVDQHDRYESRNGSVEHLLNAKYDPGERLLAAKAKKAGVAREDIQAATSKYYTLGALKEALSCRETGAPRSFASGTGICKNDYSVESETLHAEWDMSLHLEMFKSRLIS